jgi:hypothetical protein
MVATAQIFLELHRTNLMTSENFGIIAMDA